MPRTKTTFKSYAAARAYVRKLKLRTMQDWINFSKGQDPEGRTRPKDIPSNPWTVYAPILAEQGKKFSINEFLGSERKTGKMTAAMKKTGDKMVTAVKKSIKQVQDTNVPQQLQEAIMSSKPMTYSKTKAVLKKLHVRSQADFNALVRMRLLPKQLPKKPSEAFKSQWKGWKNFLGTPSHRA